MVALHSDCMGICERCIHAPDCAINTSQPPRETRQAPQALEQLRRKISNKIAIVEAGGLVDAGAYLDLARMVLIMEAWQ